MNRFTAALLIGAVTLSGCGEPIRGMDEDAKAAKAQARDAVDAATAAARRVDELSRAPAGQPTDAH